MKKILAIAMAIVMMMAITVPAFAGEITVSGANDTTTIKTNTDAVGAGSFTVTIPAEVEIYWGTPATNVNYSVTSQLETGKAVKVTVAGNGKMKNAANAELAYTLTDTEFKTTAPVVTDAAAAVKVNVTSDAWAAASIDTYSDTLTFTAVVEAL